ncbi:MAG: hypothetical protein IKX00_01745 [Bacilli bacterium]|nr:hypothetical protein [Bacilli bacterium]
MNQNANNDLSKPIDFNMAELAKETKKIDDYNKAHHPEKVFSDKPSELPVINIGEQERNQIDLKHIYDLIDKSTNKNNGIKKSKRIKPKDVAVAVTIALSLTSICSAFGLFIEDRIKTNLKEREFEAAVEYINDNYMSQIFFNSGFNVVPDEKGNPVYSFDRTNYIKAVNGLMELGFTSDEAELTIGKILKEDQRIYPEDMTPAEYYGSKLEIEKPDVRDEFDKAINNEKLYKEQHEQDVIDKVKQIKEEGPRNNARS